MMMTNPYIWVISPISCWNNPIDPITIVPSTSLNRAIQEVDGKILLGLPLHRHHRHLQPLEVVFFFLCVFFFPLFVEGKPIWRIGNPPKHTSLGTHNLKF